MGGANPPGARHKEPDDAEPGRHWASRPCSGKDCQVQNPLTANRPFERATRFLALFDKPLSGLVLWLAKIAAALAGCAIPKGRSPRIRIPEAPTLAGHFFLRPSGPYSSALTAVRFATLPSRKATQLASPFLGGSGKP
jgi:hypothetical protein